MIIPTIISRKMRDLFRSTQTKLFFIIAFIAIIFGAVLYKSITITLIQFVLYYMIIKNINCMIYGGCKLNSWIITFIPVIGIIIFMLDYFNKFKSLKNTLRIIYNKYDSLVPGDKIKIMYKNKNIPL